MYRVITKYYNRFTLNICWQIKNTIQNTSLKAILKEQNDNPNPIITLCCSLTNLDYLVLIRLLHCVSNRIKCNNVWLTSTHFKEQPWKHQNLNSRPPLPLQLNTPEPRARLISLTDHWIYGFGDITSVNYSARLGLCLALLFQEQPS